MFILVRQCLDHEELVGYAEKEKDLERYIDAHEDYHGGESPFYVKEVVPISKVNLDGSVKG